MDVACIQETKLLPMDKTPLITQYMAVRSDRQMHWEARGGGLIIYVRAALAFSAIYSAVVTSIVLMKLAVVIPLPGQLKILVNNWYLPPEISNFLQRVGFTDSKFQAKLQQSDITCADLFSHDPLMDQVARHTER